MCVRNRLQTATAAALVNSPPAILGEVFKGEH